MKKLRLLSQVMIAGAHRLRDEIVEVGKQVADDLISRELAVLHIEAAPEPAQEEAKPEAQPEPQPIAKKSKGKK